MKHPILLNIAKQFPDLKTRHKAPANCAYSIPFAKGIHWENKDFNVIEQDYDAKDAYLSLIEINTKISLDLNISCIQTDLYWFYQLSGLTKFHIPNKDETDYFAVNSQEYTIIYASQRNYDLQIDKGCHLMFFFVIKADWLLRPEDEYLNQFKPLLAKLKHGTIACVNTRKLPIHHIIHKEFLQLVKTPILKGLEMDAAIYKPISKLVNISHQDWSDKNIGKQDSFALIQSVRTFIKNQIKHGEIPPLSEIASTFELSNQYLARIHKEHYGYTLQKFLIICRLEEGRYLIKEEDYTSSAAAYRLGYSQPSSFSEQFKQYYNISPSEIKKDE